MVVTFPGPCTVDAGRFVSFLQNWRLWRFLNDNEWTLCNIVEHEIVENDIHQNLTEKTLNEITYLPHKAVAEVSKNKEPIGRECAESNWFESQLMSDSNELRVKWFGCHLIWDSNDFGCQLIWDSIDLVVNWFEIQMIWLSIDLRFKWFGCQSVCASNDFGCLLIWTSSDVVVNWFEIQMIRLSIDLRFKWFGCQSVCASNDFGCLLIWTSSDVVVNWFEIQMIWLSADEWFKWFCQTKLFCETSFKLEALKLKNEAFVRDFLQNWSFEAQKRSFCARLPSKMKLWRSKTKQFCETSFKNEALKPKNEAIPRDFLQKWSFGDPKPSFSARLPSKRNLWRSKTKHCCETSFKNNKLTRHLTSEFQYVLTILKWTLQKYCACHEKVEPRHTKSCNCHAKWSLQSNISVTSNLQPFHGFSVGGFKHRHHRARNHCACHAKRIVSDPLQIPHACQRFCNPHELLRLPRILQRVEIPAPATWNTLWTSKNVPRPSVFNDFDVRIVRARRRGANFVDVNFQKCSDHATFERFWLPNRSRAQAWCKFCRCQLPNVLRACQFLTIFIAKSLPRAGVVQILSRSTSKSRPISTSKSLSRAGVVQILSTSWTADPSQLPFFGPTFPEPRIHLN